MSNKKEYDAVVHTLKEFLEAVNAGKKRILWIDQEMPSELAEAYKVKRTKFVEKMLARLREEANL